MPWGTVGRERFEWCGGGNTAWAAMIVGTQGRRHELPEHFSFANPMDMWNRKLRSFANIVRPTNPTTGLPAARTTTFTATSIYDKQGSQRANGAEHKQYILPQPAPAFLKFDFLTAHHAPLAYLGASAHRANKRITG